MYGRIRTIARLYESIAGQNRKHVPGLILPHQISVALADELLHSSRAGLSQKPIRKRFIVVLADQPEAGSMVLEVVGSMQRRSKPPGVTERHLVLK